MAQTKTIKNAPPRPNYPDRSASEWAAYEQGKRDARPQLGDDRNPFEPGSAEHRSYFNAYNTVADQYEVLIYNCYTRQTIAKLQGRAEARGDENPVQPIEG